MNATAPNPIHGGGPSAQRTRRAFLRALPVGATAATAGALAACGAQTGTPPGAASSSRPSGRVEFFDWWLPTLSPLQAAWFKFVKQDFEQKHPGVTLDLQFIDGSSAVRDKLRTTIAADTPPTASHLSMIFSRAMWDAGLLEDLTPYVAKTPDVAMSTFLDQALVYNQKGGKVFGIPMEGPDADCLFYNKRHFAEVGLDPSPTKTFTWTWNDLLNAGTKLTKGSADAVERRGLRLAPLGMDAVTAWLYTNGSSWTTPDQMKVAFNTAPGIQTVEYLLDMNRRFPDPPNVAGLTADRQFADQKTSIVTQGNYSVHSVRGAAPDVDFDMMPFPKGPAGKSPASKVWMNQVVMPRNAKGKDLGWLFMAYYSGKETIARRMPILNRMGPRKDFFESNEFKEEAKKVPVLAQAPRVAALAGARPFLMFDEMNAIAGTVFGKITRGEIGGRDGLDQAEQEINRVLATAPK